MVVTDTSTPSCTSPSASGTLTVNPSPVADASASPIECFGGTTTITVSANGGTLPYQYSIDAGANLQSGPTFSGAGVDSTQILVLDANGCSATKLFELQENDLIVPSIVGCPAGPIVQPADPEKCGAIVSWTEPTVSDNCPGATIFQSGGRNNGSLFPPGDTLVTYTARDIAGHEVHCSFTVTVTGLPPLTIAGCPSDITLETGSGAPTCDQTATWTPPTVTGPCPGLIVVRNHDPGDTFPIGTTQVTYTATDASGGLATCSFNVTVLDSTAPNIVSCPSARTVGTDGACVAHVPDLLSEVVATDNWTPRGALVLSQSPSAGVAINPGDTVSVTITVKDSDNNLSQCSVMSPRRFPECECEQFASGLLWRCRRNRDRECRGRNSAVSIQAGWRQLPIERGVRQRLGGLSHSHGPGCQRLTKTAAQPSVAPQRHCRQYLERE